MWAWVDGADQCGDVRSVCVYIVWACIVCAMLTTTMQGSPPCHHGRVAAKQELPEALSWSVRLLAIAQHCGFESFLRPRARMRPYKNFSPRLLDLLLASAPVFFFSSPSAGFSLFLSCLIFCCHLPVCRLVCLCLMDYPTDRQPDRLMDVFLLSFFLSNASMIHLYLSTHPPIPSSALPIPNRQKSYQRNTRPFRTLRRSIGRRRLPPTRRGTRQR